MRSRTAAFAQAKELCRGCVPVSKGRWIPAGGAPMYNFGIASTLKTWFDYVLRAAITFKYAEVAPWACLRASVPSSLRPRWSLQRGSGTDDGFPGAAPSTSVELHGHHEREVFPSRAVTAVYWSADSGTLGSTRRMCHPSASRR